MKKVVKGAKHQTRPSASYYYNELGVQVGYQVRYRPRKGGKMILHSLQLRKNGTPYWRAEEKLPTLKRSKRRNTRKRSSRRSTRRRRGTHKRSSRRSTRRRSARRSPRRRRQRGTRGTRQRRTRGKGRMHDDVVRFGEIAEEGWIWAPPPQPGQLPYTTTFIPIDKNNSLQSTGII